MPQITVIVPVYKVEEYLPTCVDKSITIALTGIAIELLSFFVKRITKSAS